MEEAGVLPHPQEPSLAPRGFGHESRAVTRPGGDDAAGRAGHSWPLPARSPTLLAWVMAPAKLPDTETPRGLRVSGTILRLMGSDSSAPPPSALSLHCFSPRLPRRPTAPQQHARQVAPRNSSTERGVCTGEPERPYGQVAWDVETERVEKERCWEAQLVSACSTLVPEEKKIGRKEQHVGVSPWCHLFFWLISVFWTLSSVYFLYWSQETSLL